SSAPSPRSPRWSTPPTTPSARTRTTDRSAGAARPGRARTDRVRGCPHGCLARAPGTSPTVRSTVRSSTRGQQWREGSWRTARTSRTGGGKGTRAVASYDEDATSMGVEAARLALRAAPAGVTVGTVLLATANPPYLDKTNASAIHAALGLPRSTVAVDAGGAVRSGVVAFGLGIHDETPVLTVLS